MVWQQQQSHRQPEYKQLRIDQPGYGGLNIKDLDFMLRTNESPKMKNMMVKDGVFKKRYGQRQLEFKTWSYANDQVWGEHRPVMFEFKGILYIMYTMQVGEHRYDFYIDSYNGTTVTNVFHLNGTDTTNGTVIYKSNPATTDEYYKKADLVNGYTTYNTGIFFMSNGSLYCMASYPGYDGHSYGGKFFRFYVFAKLNKSTGNFEMQKITNESQFYVPTVAINAKPDATYFDVDGMDSFNIINPRARIEYNGDGTSKVYKIPQIFLDESKMGYIVKVEINEQVTTAYTKTYGQVTFTTAPAKGQNNVAITISPVANGDSFTNYSYAHLAAEIFGAQFCTTFGGANNSRMFVSGASERYIYSEVNDPTYFPAINYGVAGYDGEQIMGFGHHYKDLVVFKKSAIYTLKYQYGADSNGDMRGLIYSQPVNQEIGCDAPNTIRKISNRLTWLSTKYGICTLVSTVLEDERNVCVVSRNVEQGERQTGLLDEANEHSFAIDFDDKYILFNNQTAEPPTSAHSANNYADCYPKLTNVYVWDYSIAPFFLSERQSVEDSARNTSWFVWDNFYTIAVKRYKKELVTLDYRFRVEGEYSPIYGISLNKLIEEENDFGASIDAYYQTPMFDFNEYGYLKTVKKMFVQCRGGITYNTQVNYLTDEDEDGEQEPENLISTSTVLWDDFTWGGFAWGETRYANTFARKCSLKKIELAGMLFSNNIVNNDMPINGIQLTYTLVKEIK